MAELNLCIFCGKEPEKPRQYGYQIAPRRNKCYCIDHFCGNGIYVSVHGYSAEEVVEKWNKIMPAADVAPVRYGEWIADDYA
ncbi:hypothetical protein [Intestinimonas massiliensis (ex Afouda et al. 2020)]|nr:hypothetical protein [Intestinimonas massiliensis (ex Afouda et al. 2020)]MCG4526929.1 hypothetical protein [Intestinimonas massiliensis (ex Afouda et al. 2020)]